jgi:tight adherence protein C
MLGLIAGAVVGVAFPLLFGAGLPVTMGVAIVLTPLGYFIPDITLYQVAYNRNERIRRDLPDSMDLLTISVEAGLPFDSALSQVARNTRGPLAEELFRVLQEMQIGLGRIEALRALAERTNVVELRGFVTAMVQADQFGIPIANVLRVQSRDMRVKRTQRAEEQAQKVPVKILFPLVFCILPALFIVVMGPAAISAYHNLLH